MVVSSTRSDAPLELMVKLGHLRPWEVSDANAAARNLKPSALRKLMSRIADQVSISLNEPLTPSDADFVLSTASNISGIFADVKNAKDIAHSVREDARGWTLVLSALDGQSYDEIVTAIRSDASAKDRESEHSAETSQAVVDKTAQIVKAYITNNRIKRQDLGQLIGSVHGALQGGFKAGTADYVQTRLEPAVPIRKSILPSYLICLEDGRKFKSLKRHLRTKYNISPSEYRAKWGLPDDYPMVAPAYSAARAELAKKIGFGRMSAVAGGRRKVVTK